MKLNKREILLISVLAVLIVMVSIVNITYSWFEPLEEKGAGMIFTDEKYIRSENCSVQLYAGTVDSNGVITYAETASANASAAGTSNTDKTKDLRYFRLKVINADNVNPSNVSLYFSKVSAGVTIGVVKPSNSCRTYASGATNVPLVRNAYVKKNVSTDEEPGTLTIEFFIRCTSDYSFTVGDYDSESNRLYLVYN